MKQYHGQSKRIRVNTVLTRASDQPETFNKLIYITMTTIDIQADIFSTTIIKSLGVKLDTFYLGDKLGYKMYVNNVLLFEGVDFKPSPLYNWDDLEANVDLLGFLSCGIHDTDREYFANYTEPQLDWANDKSGGITIREQLSGLVSDVSDKRSEYYKSGRKLFHHQTY